MFKAVLEGMASKIRYLQEYKEDREHLRIELVKHRHTNDKLKKEIRELKEENREMTRTINQMKEVMLAYDHELIDLQTEDTYLID